MKALLPLTLIALSACSGGRPLMEPICTTDADCAEGMLCFAEGCGDPGKNIVVEVEGGALNGQFARDFKLEAGTLGKTFDCKIGGAAKKPPSPLNCGKNEMP